MKKKVQIVSIFILIIILGNILFNSFEYDVEAVTQSVSSDINSLDNNKYPGIKEKIENLKAEHPNWNFKILYTGIDWNEAVTYEYTGHGSSPKNLVPDTSSYAGDWVCGYCGDTAYDSGSWKCASISAIEYMMDPRASLNSSDIFQFLELSYDDSSGYSRDVVKQMLSGSFLDNDSYINTIMNACKTYNVNPYYIAARIIQEQGKNGSTLTKGNGYNGQYVGYYNVFNIGASGSNSEKVILNGLAKAQSYGWTSMELSLEGGIKIIASSYIAVGQNTMYFQKFDVENSDGKMYWHQYMQNILAAQNEGTTLRKTLSNISATDYSYTFTIPVYENMPTNTSSRPSTTSTSQKVEIDLVYTNVTSSIKMRNEPNGSKINGYLYSGEIATRLERATEKVNGAYWDKILKSDGTVGYVARTTYDYESTYKEYLIAVGGEGLTSDNNNNDDNNNNNSSDNNNNNSDNNDNSGNGSSSANLLGDANTDGLRDSADLLYLQKYLLNKIQLTEEQKENADTNSDNVIDSADLLNIQKYLLGKITL